MIMDLYITIDGGTTNTRISLIKNKIVVDAVKLNIGARIGIENKDLIKTAIKEAIEKLLKENSINKKDVICILASGMITSEFGLCNLEHIKAPAGINELHNNMHKTELKEITDIPFVFIRGIRIDDESFENADVMRGEETELMGMINPDYGKCVYILPGSHSKIIKCYEDGRIRDFSTMLTGEMIAALSQQTILKDAVNLKISDINSEYLLNGYDFCSCNGINKALFKVRILKNIFKCDEEKIYSFFIGIVLCGEIEQILNCDVETVVIGGKTQIKNAMAMILAKRSDKKIISLNEDTVNNSTSLGAIRIFEHRRE